MSGKDNKKFKVPYFQVPNAVFDTDLNLSANEILALIYLYRCSNQGAEAYPGYAGIAKRCSIGKTSARNAILKLEEKGIIKVTRRPKANKDNLPNLYKIIYLPISPDDIAPISGDDTGISIDDIAPISPDDIPISGDDTDKELPNKNYANKEPEEELPPATSSNLNEKENPLNAAIGRYIELFKEYTDKEPSIKRGMDHQLMKDIIKSRGLEETLQLLDLYFANADEFVINKQGFSIGWFAKSINALITQLGGKAGASLTGQKNVDEALRLVAKYSRDKNDLTNYSDPNKYEHLYDAPLPGHSGIKTEMVMCDLCNTAIQYRGPKDDERILKEHKEHTCSANKIKYGEYVTMTEAEYNQLLEYCKQNEPITKQLITILDNYKGATGKVYDNDHRAILSWVVKKYEDDNGKICREKVIES